MDPYYFISGDMFRITRRGGAVKSEKSRKALSWFLHDFK